MKPIILFLLLLSIVTIAQADNQDDSRGNRACYGQTFDCVVPDTEKQLIEEYYTCHRKLSTAGTIDQMNAVSAECNGVLSSYLPSQITDWIGLVQSLNVFTIALSSELSLHIENSPAVSLNSGQLVKFSATITKKQVDFSQFNGTYYPITAQLTEIIPLN